jgi:hypothetical protein
MSKPDWDAAGCHPSPGLLLRYSELDLPDGEMEAVSDHLRRCWSCSAEFEHLKQGIWAFMEFREKVLLPGVPVDGAFAPVRQALLAASSEDRGATRAWQDAARRFLTRISTANSRPAWIAGAVSAAAVLALVYAGMMSPPSLLASEFIYNVRHSLAQAQKSQSGKLVIQKIRLRRAAFVIDREVLSGSRTASSTVGEKEPPWVRSMSTTLGWENPLGFDSILEWRARQASLSERVSVDSGFVTLRLTLKKADPAVDENIREVLVTARNSDWHVIGKRVEFRYGPSIEATEIAWSVAEPPVSMTLTRSEKPVAPVTSAISSFSVSPVRPADPDLTEVRVREVLFQNRADLALAEVPITLSRTAGSIRLDGVISDPAARNELQRALRRIPNVSDQVRSAAELAPPQHLIRGVHSMPSNVDTATNETVDPPLLRKKLIEKFGGELQATDFANRILEESGESFSITVEYNDLAERFRYPGEKLLAPDARIELNDLAREIETALKAQLNHEVELLAPFLGETSRPDPALDTDWQARARALFQLASQKRRALSILFAVTSRAPSEKTSIEVELGHLKQCLQDMRTSIP